MTGSGRSWTGTDTHLFLTAYGAHLDADSGELATSELSAFVLRQALITVRKDDGIDIGEVVDRWDASPDLAGQGVGYLLHGLLDYIVDGHFEAVQSLDDAVEDLEDDLFADTPPRPRCSGAASSCASRWCCCAGSCCRCARW